MGDKTGLASGYAYRGETIHVDCEGASIWPTWMGKRVPFLNKAEAEAFVDAHWATMQDCPWCMKPSKGPLITVNGCLVGADHETCRADAMVGDVLFASYIQSSTVSES